jgi:hypothetical protein
LPGRTASEAKEAFLAPLRRAASCVTGVQLLISGDHSDRPGSRQSITFLELPTFRSVRLKCELSFRLVHAYKLDFDPTKPGHEQWKVRSERYYYSLLHAADRREMLSWHWHPNTGDPRPHLHHGVGLGDLRHIPTGRVTVESIIRYLLVDLDVPPKRDDFLQVLDEAERLHVEHRSWHAYPP